MKKEVWQQTFSKKKNFADGFAKERYYKGFFINIFWQMKEVLIKKLTGEFDKENLVKGAL